MARTRETARERSERLGQRAQAEQELNQWMGRMAVAVTAQDGAACRAAMMATSELRDRITALYQPGACSSPQAPRVVLASARPPTRDHLRWMIYHGNPEQEQRARADWRLNYPEEVQTCQLCGESGILEMDAMAEMYDPLEAGDAYICHHQCGLDQELVLA